MSMLGPTPSGKRGDTVGETIASFPTYEGAQKAVSALIAGEVPARDIAIVGQGLRSIERVTGRLGYATAARSGAVNGLLIGLFFSAILVLGSPAVPIQAFVGVLFVGVAVGMLLSIITYSFIRRRRDFASVMQVLADHYEVTVAPANLAKARQVLGVSGGTPTAPAGSAPSTPPTPPSGVPTPPSGVPTPPSGVPAPPPATSDHRPVLPPDAAPPRYGERLHRDVADSPPRYGQRVERAVPDASVVHDADAPRSPKTPAEATEEDPDASTGGRDASVDRPSGS